MVRVLGDGGQHLALCLLSAVDSGRVVPGGDVGPNRWVPFRPEGNGPGTQRPWRRRPTAGISPNLEPARHGPSKTNGGGRRRRRPSRPKGR